jgi:inhibitor of the pro-sigma K processing machinery
MPIKLDSNVMTFLLVVLALLAIAMAMRSRASKVIKIVFQLILGGVCLLLFNAIGSNFNITIPLNPITAFFAGIFQIPGVAFLLIVKYIIYS